MKLQKEYLLEEKSLLGGGECSQQPYPFGLTTIKQDCSGEWIQLHMQFIFTK